MATITQQIISSFSDLGSNLLETHEFYDNLPLYNQGTIRATLSRLTKRGKIERIDRGLYLITAMYRMYRHAKRIYDTNKRDPVHAFDLDIELTCEGLAPSDLTISQVENVCNPKLLNRSLEMLDEEGVHLFEEIIEFNVVGTEDLNQTELNYNSLWQVEVKLVNNVGSHYTFNGFMDIAESEW